MHRLYIFDLDGVILQPNGYRHATADTLRAFCSQMGLPDLAPDEHIIALLEAAGITCEWDHVPISLAVILNAAAERVGLALPGTTLTGAIRNIREQAINLTGIDYEPVVEMLKQLSRPGIALSESVLAACRTKGGNGLFPALRIELLEELFAQTRDVLASPTTRIFQARVLGQRVFNAVYGEQAEIESDSYLMKYDQPLLADAERRALLQLLGAGQIGLAAATARYSLPPTGSDGHAAMYSPEAEMALERAGLAGIPLVGYGSLNYLAEQLGFSGERLLKPVPVQALAAIAAANGNPVMDAVAWGYQLVAGEEKYSDLPQLRLENTSLPRPLDADLEIHIFEDSPIGIQACREAVSILEHHGFHAHLDAWGIARHPAKQQALAALGARIFPDINTALRQALPLDPGGGDLA